MSADARWIWRIVACLGVGACALLARSNLDRYLRHRDTGDQTGFALGMALLVFGFVPATSAALVLGTAPGAAARERAGPGAWLARLAVSGALITGAGFFLGFPASMRGMRVGDVASGLAEAPGPWSFALGEGVLIAFAVLQVACAAAVLRPAASRTWWFGAILVAVGMAALAAVVAAVSMSGPATVMVALPWVAWAFVVAWVVRAMRRSEPEAG